MKSKMISLYIFLGALIAVLCACEGYDDTLAGEAYFDKALSSLETYQAEEHSFQSGCSKQSKHSGYTGSGFMDYGGDGSLVEWNNVEAPLAGKYTLTFRYANGNSADRRCAVTVNDTNSAGNVAFRSTGGWTKWSTVSITADLKAGNNKIRVTANTGNGGPNLDKMDLFSEEDPVVGTKRCALVNENDTATLSCPSGQVIESIDFASYGLPTGTCPNFLRNSSCHSTRSPSAVEGLCLEQESCKIGANNTVFGDPCSGKYKKLAVVYTCSGEKTSLKIEDFVGHYERTPILNNWHKVDIALENNALRWKNAAGATWSLSYAGGVLKTGSDCPYGVKVIEVEDQDGSAPIKSLIFNQEVYDKTNGNTDDCPNDPKKTQPGECGCGEVEDIADDDNDGVINCKDECPLDPGKTEPGRCGCGTEESITCGNSDAWQSEMVNYNDQGKLQYKTDVEGNRIPDFSYVGYKYGEKIPEVQVVHTISPVSGDNTSHIQNAINYVANKYSKNSKGLRGVLLLKPGIYNTDNIIYINHDGVVVRGSGMGEKPDHDTIIKSSRTGTDKAVFVMGNPNSSMYWNASVKNSTVSITDSFIQIGERSFTVSSSTPFSVGDLVVIRQKTNDAWMNAVDNGGTVNDPGWKESGFYLPLSFTRFITEVSGRKITVDAPFYNKLDKNHGELIVYKYDKESSRDKIFQNIGIENLTVDIVTEGEYDNAHTEIGVNIEGVIDGWVKNVQVRHPSEAAVRIGRSLRVTVENVIGGPSAAVIEGGRRSMFVVASGGQQVLFKDCTAIAARHGFVLNGQTRSSGVVVLRGKLIDNISGSEGGHQQWSMGVLFDSCTVESVLVHNQTFLLANRGDWGTAHGWGTANSVVWNTDSTAGGKIVVQKPPTAQNYVIGCFGDINTSWVFPGDWGYTEGNNQEGTIYPSSLYEAQLKDR